MTDADRIEALADALADVLKDEPLHIAAPAVGMLWAITVAQVADAKGESMRDAGSRVAARLEAIWPTEKHH